jgi:nucleoside-diphosphate-sugar epimerase
LPKTILICGTGYIGSELARTLVEDNSSVIAIKRSPPNEPVKGVTYLLCDLAEERQLEKLPTNVDEIVFCAAPSNHTENDYREVYVEAIGNVVKSYESRGVTPRIIFTSSTSVYGQDNGEIVDESSQTIPQAFSGRTVLEGEQILRDSSLPWVVLRFGGIYGPGRMGMLQRLKSGAGIEQLSARELDTYTNRIHLIDCIGIILFVIKSDLARVVINCVDEKPVTRRGIASHFTSVALPESSGYFGKQVSSAYLQSLGYKFAIRDFTNS